jgi:hypothetical protein
MWTKEPPIQVMWKSLRGSGILRACPPISTGFSTLLITHTVVVSALKPRRIPRESGVFAGE